VVSLQELVPDAEDVVAMEPEELAGYLLEHLTSKSEDELGRLNAYNFSLHCANAYPEDRREEVATAWLEAWAWLEREVMIAPGPGQDGNWKGLTRRGSKVLNRQGWENYRRSTALPRDLLHPAVYVEVRTDYMAGKLDIAVFRAYRAVEMAVRGAAGYDNALSGSALMGKAFHVESGPLTDKTEERAEREGLRNLFMGATLYFRNPTAHRAVSLTPASATEAIALASHLMRIVDERKAAGNAAAGR